jgi:hypothetical protein
MRPQGPVKVGCGGALAKALGRPDTNPAATDDPWTRFRFWIKLKRSQIPRKRWLNFLVPPWGNGLAFASPC